MIIFFFTEETMNISTNPHWGLIIVSSTNRTKIYIYMTVKYINKLIYVVCTLDEFIMRFRKQDFTIILSPIAVPIKFNTKKYASTTLFEIENKNDICCLRTRDYRLFLYTMSKFQIATHHFFLLFFSTNLIINFFYANMRLFTRSPKTSNDKTTK